MVIDPGVPSLSSRSSPSRRDEILRKACRLFAEHGFRRVTVDDVGSACGISGPAIYHHFSSKEAILGEMLVSISQHLLAKGRGIAEVGADPVTTVRALIAAHAEFATTNPDLITVQVRDLHQALEEDQRTVRRLQRQYVEVWVDALRRRFTAITARELRAAVHATFGLLNSTPYAGSGSARNNRLLCDLAARALELDRTASP